MLLNKKKIKKIKTFLTSTHPNARKQTQNKAETHEISRRISEFPWTNYGCFSRHLYLGLPKCRCLSSAHDSLRKQLTFRDATTGFPAKWPLKKISSAARPIRSTTHNSSVWNSRARFSDVRKCRLFSQATHVIPVLRVTAILLPSTMDQKLWLTRSRKSQIIDFRLSVQSRTWETTVRKCETTALAHYSTPS